MAGEILTNIKNYITQNTRNKIIFCHESIDGLKFVNVGYDLSQLLSKNSYNYEEAVSAILDNTNHNESIGDYLALTNIAILFEPFTSGVRPQRQNLLVFSLLNRKNVVSLQPQ
jgi:hypothetical protein